MYDRNTANICAEQPAYLNFERGNEFNRTPYFRVRIGSDFCNNINSNNQRFPPIWYIFSFFICGSSWYKPRNNIWNTKFAADVFPKPLGRLLSTLLPWNATNYCLKCNIWSYLSLLIFVHVEVTPDLGFVLCTICRSSLVSYRLAVHVKYGRFTFCHTTEATPISTKFSFSL